MKTMTVKNLPVQLGKRRYSLSVDNRKLKIKVDDNNLGVLTSTLKRPGAKEYADVLYNASIDGLESLLLACACAGVDVDSPQFTRAFETAYESICNVYGE
jgi:hypothetical protein